MEQQIISLAEFLKAKRKQQNLTQSELAEKAGVGLRFIREIEQGKTTLRMDKVNQVLQLFGCELGAVNMDRKKLLNEKG
ncbi:MAG: helix-turn-helix transcriptional regulator [Bacteroidetes bacterium]|nr:helix-turn-helix transcriptional regulator [Bacteroidota bacterium]MBP7399171.1 helix-turn-helix transcriptional regulator [Chitinophagales bacterium]MBK7108076.1 helix-turn-helix transcriptional regulator [Bacteroidota bacterium]MBK8486490.1 helix-turn-helix transcriptional regulator [Bacteroidota bacterium]MBK8683275.1 helix-turn-helix transcriptional regulator [Bacteroidota bacterium]